MLSESLRVTFALHIKRWLWWLFVFTVAISACWCWECIYVRSPQPLDTCFWCFFFSLSASFCVGVRVCATSWSRYTKLNSRRHFKYNTIVRATVWVYASYIVVVVGVGNDDFRISFRSYLAAVAIAIPISIQSDVCVCAWNVHDTNV